MQLFMTKLMIRTLIASVCDFCYTITDLEFLSWPYSILIFMSLGFDDFGRVIHPFEKYGMCYSLSAAAKL